MIDIELVAGCSLKAVAMLLKAEAFTARNRLQPTMSLALSKTLPDVRFAPTLNRGARTLHNERLDLTLSDFPAIGLDLFELVLQRC